ncbi:hypothetical protein HK097_005630, partial [Rhizophlyctis rosea]
GDGEEGSDDDDEDDDEEDDEEEGSQDEVSFDEEDEDDESGLTRKCGGSGEKKDEVFGDQEDVKGVVERDSEGGGEEELAFRSPVSKDMLATASLILKMDDLSDLMWTSAGASKPQTAKPLNQLGGMGANSGQTPPFTPTASGASTPRYGGGQTLPTFTGTGPNASNTFRPAAPSSYTSSSYNQPSSRLQTSAPPSRSVSPGPNVALRSDDVFGNLVNFGGPTKATLANMSLNDQRRQQQAQAQGQSLNVQQQRPQYAPHSRSQSSTPFGTSPQAGIGSLGSMQQPQRPVSPAVNTPANLSGRNTPQPHGAFFAGFGGGSGNASPSSDGARPSSAQSQKSNDLFGDIFGKSPTPVSHPAPSAQFNGVPTQQPLSVGTPNATGPSAWDFDFLASGGAGTKTGPTSTVAGGDDPFDIGFLGSQKGSSPSANAPSQEDDNPLGILAKPVQP